MKKPQTTEKPSWRETFLASPAGKKHLEDIETGAPLQEWQREAIASKTVMEHRQALTDSIIALRLMVEYQGDKEAVMALVECGVQAAHQLHTLHQGDDANACPTTEPRAVMLVNEVAASAERWPVAMSAFQEKRVTLPPGIGSKLPFRARSLGGSGGTRKLGKDDPAGFTLETLEGIERYRARHDCFDFLSPSWFFAGCVPGVIRFFEEDKWGEEADALEPFSAKSLKKWVKVAMLKLESECAGEWSKYPFPQAIMIEASTIFRDSVARRRTSKAKIASGIPAEIPQNYIKLAVKSVLAKRSKSFLTK